MRGGHGGQRLEGVDVVQPDGHRPRQVALDHQAEAAGLGEEVQRVGQVGLVQVDAHARAAAGARGRRRGRCWADADRLGGLERSRWRR